GYTGHTLQAEQLIPDGEVLITITARGEIQRIMNVARKPRSGSDYAQIVLANNRHEMLLVSKSGRAWRTPVYQLPEKTGQGKGDQLAQLLSGWERKEEVASALDVTNDEGQLADSYLIVVTRSARVVRVSASEVKNLHTGTLLVNLEPGDEVIWAGFSLGDDYLVLASAQGQAIRFPESDVRPTGIGVQGVWGIKLEEKRDAVVGAGLARQGDSLVVITERGMHKRTPLADYPIQGRYGKGVRAMNLGATTGLLAAAAVVLESDRITFQSNKKPAFDVQVRHVPQTDRYHQGQSVGDLSVTQNINSLVRWEMAGVWPDGGSGIESASTTPQGGQESPAPMGGKKKRPVRSVKKARKSTSAKKSSKKDNGRQLSLEIADSASKSAGPNSRKKGKPVARGKAKKR
ncbi:MAG: DNA gyrase C-terminal beta-propeller domain-containing protein, partial [Ardenticatenaceae bacterium]